MVGMDGQQRVIIEGVSPEVDGGRFPIKRVEGGRVTVEADVFADGHDRLAVVLQHRRDGAKAWEETAMEPLGSDRWRASFPVPEVGRYQYTLTGWVDPFRSWLNKVQKKAEAGQDVSVELQVGVQLVEAAAQRAKGEDRKALAAHAEALRGEGRVRDRLRRAARTDLGALMFQHADRSHATTYATELEVLVDRERAAFSAWYELFPRSCGPPGKHGTLRDCIDRLEYVASLGFDVLYLPPIHPIGPTNRKGRNGSPEPRPDDPGSPWAIGGEEGGHTAVHPELGTLEDFRALVEAARKRGLEVALDLAFQCSPDHPWVAEHPEWFRWRPDGTLQYAENPPKKYEDIYPLDFETEDWQALWQALKDVVDFWIDQGVTLFRVDNPHTKPFAFWEWLLGEVRREHPDVLFLSEAFTRPKVMYRLAKLGFHQSYTYFAWRNGKGELEAYFRELTQTEVAEYFRPNLWPNTPDILTEYLQSGGPPAFRVRLILAATLGANYGIYGPAFEVCENRPREPGSEEYLNSEKYEIRDWDLDRPDSLRDLVARVNRIRRESPALQRDDTLRFHPVDNEHLLAYSKRAADGGNVVLVVVNLDPHHAQSGWVELPLADLGVEGDRPFQVHDLLDGERYIWDGPRNYVELDPQVRPAHVLWVPGRGHTEEDFNYYT